MRDNKTKDISSFGVLFLISSMLIFLILANPVSSVDVDFYDSYTGQSSNTLDRITWVDSDQFGYSITLGVLSPIQTPIAYCVNKDKDVDSTFEFCIAKDTSSSSLCSGVYPSGVVTAYDTTSSSSWYYADVVDIIISTSAIDSGGTGNTFWSDVKTIHRGQISYYYDVSGVCTLAGFSANSASFDYYFIDKTFNICDADRSDDYEIRGYYGSTQHILVDSETCATNFVCDTDHDYQESTSPTSKPSHPCKIDLNAPVVCSVSSECWNDNVCSGARTRYQGSCNIVNNNKVDVTTLTYTDNCGGNGILTNEVISYNNLCEDNGFPSGYVCDDNFNTGELTSIANVYNNICKGGIGNSCTIDSDCHNSFECVNGFCGYVAISIYTDDEDDNKLLKGETVTYDNSLSFSSDNDIQYACWSINDVNVECDGNSTQCTTYCGISSSHPSWDNGYVKTFSSGGNYVVKLVVGNGALYSDDYSESYCVSGDGTYCFSCFDNIKNDDETDIDWGGHCGKPYFFKCNNRILDNVTNETSIDYGGFCGQCDNSSIYDDERIIFLKQGNLIVYPFDIEQCGFVDEIQGGTVMFVFLLSLIILIPALFIFVILIIILLFAGTGAFGLFFGLARRDQGTITNSVTNFFNRNNKKK